jgi:hypothetical protein
MSRDPGPPYNLDEMRRVGPPAVSPRLATVTTLQPKLERDKYQEAVTVLKDALAEIESGKLTPSDVVICMVVPHKTQPDTDCFNYRCSDLGTLSTIGLLQLVCIDIAEGD